MSRQTSAPAAPRAPSTTERASFAPHSPLRAELNAEVEDYFRRTGLDPHGGAPMWLKTAVILTWALVSYALLVFVASSWWSAVPLAASLGLALAGVGFCVMHDGNHGSYSGRTGVNRAAGASLDLIGGSSYMWRHKHNVLHHTYTNIEGLDDDIELRPFFRLSVGQRRFWFHRFQFLYWVPLFLFFTTKWIFVDDLVVLARGAMGRHPLRRPRGLELAQFIGGKLFFCAWGVVIPLLVVAPLPYLVGYVIVSTVLGLTMGAVFQLAHVVDTVTFVSAGARGALPSWIEHQVATTADFARGNRLLTWYLGGLNFQVEHHLFPRVGHRHYPALAPIVREVCGRHGITVHDDPTLLGAFAAHLRHLIHMGTLPNLQPREGAAAQPELALERAQA